MPTMEEIENTQTWFDKLGQKKRMSLAELEAQSKAKLSTEPKSLSELESWTPEKQKQEELQQAMEQGFEAVTPGSALITRAARRGWGYHGTRAEVPEVLKRGFLKGQSAELSLPGTSTSLDPSVALREQFSRGSPENIVKGVFKEAPEALSPADYVLGIIPEKGKIYSKPNIMFNEMESFGIRDLDNTDPYLHEMLIDLGNKISITKYHLEKATSKPAMDKYTKDLVKLDKDYMDVAERITNPSIIPKALSQQELVQVSKADKLRFDLTNAQVRALQRGVKTELPAGYSNVPTGAVFDFKSAKEYAGIILRAKEFPGQLSEEISQGPGYFYKALRQLDMNLYKASNPLTKAFTKMDRAIGKLEENKQKLQNGFWSQADAYGDMFTTKQGKQMFNDSYREAVVAKKDLMDLLEESMKIPKGSDPLKNKTIRKILERTDPQSLEILDPLASSMKPQEQPIFNFLK